MLSPANLWSFDDHRLVVLFKSVNKFVAAHLILINTLHIVVKFPKWFEPIDIVVRYPRASVIQFWMQQEQEKVQSNIANAWTDRMFSIN